MLWFHSLSYRAQTIEHLVLSQTLSSPSLSPNRIPKVHISEDEEGGKEIELSDDPYDCMRLNVENVPCIVTLCKVGSVIHMATPAEMVLVYQITSFTWV